MTTIDEIMVEVIESQDAALSWYLHTIPESELDTQVAKVRTLITQAIAEARADGAREMREPVRLTDREREATIFAVAKEFLGGAGLEVDSWDTELARAVETAVLAANGMTK
jgi:hypothetical protein